MRPPSFDGWYAFTAAIVVFSRAIRLRSASSAGTGGDAAAAAEARPRRYARRRLQGRAAEAFTLRTTFSHRTRAFVSASGIGLSAVGQGLPKSARRETVRPSDSRRRAVSNASAPPRQYPAIRSGPAGLKDWMSSAKTLATSPTVVRAGLRPSSPRGWRA